MLTAQGMSELADQLDPLEAEANHGRGIESVRWLIGLLRRGKWDEAVYFVRGEWDKISSYPAIKQLIIDAKLFTAIDFTTFAQD